MKKLNNKAFGLIEAVISVLLLSIVLLAGITLYFNADEVMSMALHKKMATEIANSKMENFKKDGYGSLPPSGIPVVTNINVGGLSGTQTVTITDIDENGDSVIDYKRAEVQLNWVEAGKVASPRQINLTTFISP